MIEIKNRITGAVLHTVEADTLENADLRGADLNGAYLRWAYLNGANLNGAYLSCANLSGADMSGADMRGANLGGADMSFANLIGADLSGADLRGADLLGADLRWAKLSDGQVPLLLKCLGIELKQAEMTPKHAQLEAINAELLEALENVYYPVLSWLGEFDLESSLSSHPAMQKARAAIAKAKGEEEEL